MKISHLLATASILALVAACNTTKGIGEDTSDLGRVISGDHAAAPVEQPAPTPVHDSDVHHRDVHHDHAVAPRTAKEEAEAAQRRVDHATARLEHAKKEKAAADARLQKESEEK
jgi:predicted small secreted protein